MSIGPGIHRHQHLTGVMVRCASLFLFHHGDWSGDGSEAEEGLLEMLEMEMRTTGLAAQSSEHF